MTNNQIDVRFDARGLVPAVLQDATTGEVLMVAWMNEEALRRTRETGQAHFWSRSRQELWHKGATSGNFMNVREIRADCDADTLLLKIEPEGPACHTGERSCFYREMGGGLTPRPPSLPGKGESAVKHDSAKATGAGSRENLVPSPVGEGPGEGPGEGSILQTLFSVILDRRANPRPGSYTARLLSAGEDEVLKKVGEEAMEVILASKGQGDERVIYEVADLFYHLLVLLAARGLSLADVEAELARRRR